jgi:hypothetical protein
MRLAIAASVQSGRALRVAKSATAFAKIVICLTNSQTLGELDKKGRSMSVHLDRSHQLAIFRLGTSQASNDADRRRRHRHASPSAGSTLAAQQPSAENRLLWLQDAVVKFNSFALKKLPLFPDATTFGDEFGVDVGTLRLVVAVQNVLRI